MVRKSFLLNTGFLIGLAMTISGDNTRRELGNTLDSEPAKSGKVIDIKIENNEADSSNNSVPLPPGSPTTAVCPGHRGVVPLIDVNTPDSINTEGDTLNEIPIIRHY